MSISEIIKAQREFYNTGKTYDLKFRLGALKSLLNAVTENEKKLLDALYTDLGKSDCEGFMTETGLSLSEIRFTIKHLPDWIRPRRVKTPLVHFEASSFVLPEPYGIALIISPWNYPVLLSLEPLAGAIAAGNCAVLKPSSNSPETSRVLAELIEGIFSPEYICAVQGNRNQNADLLKQQFDHIFFSGSMATGKIVMEAASKNLTPVCLELGGKCPAIIDETADIALSAKRLAFGKFINAGQTCVAPDYTFVHQSKKDDLVCSLGRAISEFYPAGLDDENLPRIVNERHFNRLLGLMEGEEVVIGGSSDKKTLKIAPTVLCGVKLDSPVMGQEIFGPILPLLTYTDLNEVVRAIKSLPKPLALYMFSKDRAFQKRILREVTFGGGCINDTIIHIATPYLGFGGVGESGMGAYHGRLSFDTFTHFKSIVDKKTWIDLPLRYAPFNKKKEKILRFFLK